MRTVRCFRVGTIARTALAIREEWLLWFIYGHMDYACPGAMLRGALRDSNKAHPQRRWAVALGSGVPSGAGRAGGHTHVRIKRPTKLRGGSMEVPRRARLRATYTAAFP